MSFATVELRRLPELGYDFGLADYPIFDEQYRNVLNTKIIEHFWFREIGFETIHMFLFALNRKMNEIMPYYNQRYKSELLNIEPFSNYGYVENVERTGEDTDKHLGSDKKEMGGKDTSFTSGTGLTTGKTTTQDTYDTADTHISAEDDKQTTAGTTTTKGTTTSTDTNTTNQKKIHSDTPQGMLDSDTVGNAKYASSADLETQTFTSNSEENNDTSVTNNQTAVTSKNGTATATKKGTVTNVNESQVNADTSNNSEQNYGRTETDLYDSSNEKKYNSEDSIKKRGYQGISTSELLLSYRETFINVDLEIINELEPLFLSVF